MRKTLTATVATTAAWIGMIVSGNPAHADCSIFDTPGSGAVLSGDASCADGAGFGENLRAGKNGTSGDVSVTGGAAVSLDANGAGDPPFMVIGRNPGGVGTATIAGAGSSITVNGGPNGAVSNATVHIGREGTGTVNVGAGAALNLLDPNAASGSSSVAGENVSVGMDGGVGTLNVDGGTVKIDSASGAFVFVGREGGVGTMNVLNGGSIDLDDSDAAAGSDGANITVGRDADGGAGGTGTLNVIGSSVDIDTVNGFAGVFVGREAGTTGTLSVSGAGASVSARSGVDDSGLTVGRDSGASGTVTVKDGAQLSLDGDRSRLTIGQLGGSSGQMTIANGGQVTVDGATDGDVFVGAAFAAFGRPNGGSGSLSITGVGSTLTVLDNVIVGAPESFGGGSSSGTLTIANGGVLNADDVFIGTGGVLNGDGGTINAGLTIDGGVIAPGASPGILTINGDLTILDGILEIEVGGLAPGEFDVLNVTGDLVAPTALSIQLTFLNGFLPEVGDEFLFLDVDGDSSDLDALILNGLLDIQLDGIPNGFEFGLNFENGELVAETTTTAPVPTPAAAPLLASAFALLAFVGRRRSVRRQSKH